MWCEWTALFYGSSQPYLAMMWVMGALGLNLSFSSACMPFKDRSVDLIDILSIMCVMLYLLAGVVADMRPVYAEDLGVMLNVIVWSLIAYCFVATIKETNGKFTAARYAKEIRRVMLRVRDAYRSSGDEEKLEADDPTLGKKLVNGEVMWTNQNTRHSLCRAFRGLKEEGYVSVTLAQIAGWLKKHGERYVHPEHPMLYMLRQVIGIRDIDNLPVESSIVALESEMRLVSVLEGIVHEDSLKAGPSVFMLTHRIHTGFI